LGGQGLGQSRLNVLRLPSRPQGLPQTLRSARFSIFGLKFLNYLLHIPVRFAATSNKPFPSTLQINAESVRIPPEWAAMLLARATQGEFSKGSVDNLTH
jgi:hypothetical protein